MSIEEELPAADVSAPGDIITIVIPSGREFYVHSNILKNYSGYFRAGLRTPMLEATTRTFHLEEYASAGAMTIFVRWLYAQANGGTWLSESPPSTDDLILAWLLGDYLDAQGFVTCIYMELDDNATAFDVGALKDHWTEIKAHPDLHACILQLAVDALASKPKMTDVIKTLPREAVEDITSVLAERVNLLTPRFHEEENMSGWGTWEDSDVASNNSTRGTQW
ncbi:hypothetical protein F4861DRAFT_543172 [Xylaria intraflava]|nr:hypothetical protein F4861DRAFT_543172 [Xylaria intraflava]